MTRRRRPLAVAVLLGLAATVALFALLREPQQPPAAQAARLVPADALAYVHVSTDREREAVRRTGELLRRFPALSRARDALLGQLTALGPGLSFERDVRPWLGAEAAIALLDARGPTATPLAVVAVGDRRRARAFFARSAARPVASSYNGTPLTTYGTLTTAFVGDFLVAGPPAAVRASLDARSAGGRALDQAAAYRRATRGMPAGRGLDAYLPAAGVDRVLAAQPGLLGAAGSVLRQPGLRATALALSPDDEGARVWVHSVRDPAAPGPPPRSFQPRLAGDIPEDALAYLGTTGLDRSAARVLGALAGNAAPALSALAARTDAEARRSGVDLRRTLLPLFRGEVAVWLKAASPAPLLTVVAATDDERATRQALAQLQASLAAALRPRRRVPGLSPPTVSERDVEGARVLSLRLGPGIEVVSSVFDGKLVLSTGVEGVRALRRSPGSLPDSDDWEATLGERPSRVTSLVFLDLAQVLRLRERSGLPGSPADRLPGELGQVRALGAATSGAKDESTTELFVLIP